MVDIQFIRENPDLVKEKSKQKGYDIDIDELLRLDSERLALLAQVEELRQKRNENAAAIKKQGKPDQAAIDTGKQIKVELAHREALLTETTEAWGIAHKQVPNMPLETVPIGNSEDQNVVVKEVGTKPNFDFTPQNHAHIAESKGWLDKERGYQNCRRALCIYEG
ncbi:MAG: hypothetical protein R3B12_01585 [Candidatus Saccharimonadales bacterium]